MFKRPTAHYGEAPAPVTPLSEGGQVWDERGVEGFVKLTELTPKSWKLSKAALSNFNGLASWRNAENGLQSVNLTMPAAPPAAGIHATTPRG